MYAELEQKICRDCKQAKDKKEFSADRTSKDGLCYYCKPCKRIRRIGYALYTVEIRRQKEFVRGLKRSYGITPEEYNQMFLKQEGKCTICYRHQSVLRRRLAVDHCHESKKIRGLLCDNCNPMLGYAKDNITILESAIEYLNKFKK